jgi:hypothetical protein
MRVFTFIFSFYFLLLAVYPAFASSNKLSTKGKCCKTTCCKKGNEQKKKDNGCNKGNCTPLFGCTKVQLTINTIEKVAFRKLFFTTKKYPQYSEKFDFSFSADAWHPQKLFN